MTRETCEVALRSFCKRRPFKNFLIELTSGDRLLITHAEAVSWRGDVLYYISPQIQERLFDSLRVRQLLDPPAAPT